MAAVKVSVKTVGGEIHELEMAKGVDTTIEELAGALVKNHEYQAHGMKLIYAGKVGKPQDTLKDLNYDVSKKFVLVAKREKSIAGTAAKRARLMADERKREEAKKAEEEAQKKKEAGESSAAPEPAAPAVSTTDEGGGLNKGLRALLKVYAEGPDYEDEDGNDSSFMKRLRDAEEYQGQFLDLCHLLSDSEQREQIFDHVKNEMPDFYEAVTEMPDLFFPTLRAAMVVYAKETGRELPNQMLDEIEGLGDMDFDSEDFEEFDSDDEDGFEMFGSAEDVVARLEGSGNDVQSVRNILRFLAQQGAGQVQLVAVPRDTREATQIAGMGDADDDAVSSASSEAAAPSAEAPSSPTNAPKDTPDAPTQTGGGRPKPQKRKREEDDE